MDEEQKMVEMQEEEEEGTAAAAAAETEEEGEANIKRRMRTRAVMLPTFSEVHLPCAPTPDNENQGYRR